MKHEMPLDDASPVRAITTYTCDEPPPLMKACAARR